MRVGMTGIGTVWVGARCIIMVVSMRVGMTRIGTTGILTRRRRCAMVMRMSMTRVGTIGVVTRFFFDDSLLFLWKHRPQNLTRRNTTVLHFFHNRLIVQRLDQRRCHLHLFRPRQIHLVDQNEIRRLDLFRQQLRHLPLRRTLVGRIDPTVPFPGDVPRHPIRPKRRRIDQRHHLRHIGQLRYRMPRRRRGLPIRLNGNWIRHATQFDNDRIELPARSVTIASS
mmetsp:Transcript_84383/g.126504  ORF Transcript_84383/g.126504 Transcript_84383/m.126504 type:complete len:224 (+) Transcript_84383:461-1132(+)